MVQLPLLMLQQTQLTRECHSSLPTNIFIRMEHFKRAIEEQQERYAAQEAIEKDRDRQERGRQRLIEMAADSGSKENRPLRGFRLWLARIFGFVR